MGFMWGSNTDKKYVSATTCIVYWFSELGMVSDWLLKVGERRLAEPNDGNAELIYRLSFWYKIGKIQYKISFESTYPDFFNDYNNLDYLQLRAIMASTIEVVEEINEYILSLIEGNFRKKTI